MENEEILQAIQDHGDLGFLQGFMVAKKNIDIEDRARLSRMMLGRCRANTFEQICKMLEGSKQKI